MANRALCITKGKVGGVVLLAKEPSRIHLIVLIVFLQLKFPPLNGMILALSPHESHLFWVKIY